MSVLFYIRFLKRIIMKVDLNRSFRIYLFISIFLISRIINLSARCTRIEFNSIPEDGTILVYPHMDDHLIRMLPFRKITEKLIGCAMPARPSYRTIISQQQTCLDNNGFNIDYESNWLTPWSDVTDREYTEQYRGNNPSYSYLVNDHPETRLFNNPTELSKHEGYPSGESLT